MKKLFDFVFVFLLLIYPFIYMLPEEFNIIGSIWGAIATLFIFLVLLAKKNAINRYVISASLIAIFIFISIFLSNEITFLKYMAGYKYVLPLLLASYIYWYPLNQKNIYMIYRILFVYLILMLMLMLYRLSIVDFNVLMVTMNKELVWYGKPHNFAQMYVLFCVSFLFFSYLLKKNVLIAYMFFLPVFFVGVRSVMLGTILFLIVFLSYTVKRNYLKFLFVLIFFTLGLISFQPDINKLTPLILSAQDANRGMENMTVTSMSSGRDIILDYYIRELDMEKFFVGSGFQYLEKDSNFGFGLHNDTLEFFFSFGLFGLFALMISVYYLIFYDAYKKTNGINRRFIVALIFLFLGISNFAFFISNQIIVYMFILIYIITYYQVPKGNLTHAN